MSLGLKRYGVDSKKKLDRGDHNFKTELLESLFRSMPADGMVTRDGIITRKQPKSTGLFIVKVQQDGGVAGDDATNCTFTYEVFDLTGDSLEAGVEPQMARYPLCTYTKAPDDSYGLAAYNEDDELLLLIAFEEIAGESVCTPP